MSHGKQSINRRSFLKRAAAISLGAISARGIYGLLDEIAAARPARAAGASATRQREQYLIEGADVVTDNGIAVIVPPLFHEVITAKVAVSNRADTLFQAQARLEQALRLVEDQHPPTPAGLTIVVGWGLPYFRTYLPTNLMDASMPVDLVYSAQSGERRLALLDAILFPSDRDECLLERNDVMLLLQSDNQSIIAAAEQSLFEDQGSLAYIGDLLNPTSVRKGFVGRGFGTRSIAKQLALAAGIDGAAAIPDAAQLMMGFTSTQQGALAPDNLVSFETMPGVTDQWPQGYFAGGCTMHLSHLFEDLKLWYTSFDQTGRVARMFSPRTFASPGTVTLPNGPSHVNTRDQLLQDAESGVLGHNVTMHQANRVVAPAGASGITDNYGVFRAAGAAISLRGDFNTLDNPFAWTANPELDQWNPDLAAPGLHFLAFTATSHQFHALRLAMDGVLPDGVNLRESPYAITDAANGINRIIRATHRQNYLIPPRQRRSFPLAELRDGVRRVFLPITAR